MSLTTLPLGLVIFDCDGVLIDSEGPSNRVLAEEITRLGWSMTQAESMARFVGHRLSDIPPVVEARLGSPVPDGWVEHLRQCLIAAFETIQPIPGAREALEATAALGIPFRIASNSSHEEMHVKFRQTGLAPLIALRQHSARDVARGKPAPDVFLAAAAAEGVPPAACLVIEDSIPGIRAAIAAGMTVIALDPHDNAAALQAEGAITIGALSDLPKLLQSALHPPA
jgi:HAD superfamily hydrolase (TIGR01509 family)